MKLPNTPHNARAIAAIFNRLNWKAVNKGLQPWSEESRAEVESQLADGEIAFDIIDDQEARLGLDVADERAQLTVLHVRAEGEGSVPTYQDWLTETFVAWRTLNNLPAMCADDMAHEYRRGRITMTEAQYQWLREFSRLWDSAD